MAQSRAQSDTRHASVFSAVLVSFLLLVVYMGAIVFIRRTTAAVEARAAELALEVRREELTRDTSNLLKGLSKETEDLSAFFVHPGGAVTLIERIEGFSLYVGVPITIRDVSFVPLAEGSEEGAVAMRVETVGSWREMTHLLSLLDTLPFEAEVSTIVLEVVNEGEDGTEWSLRAALTVLLRE
ncbi:MAG: hypothetical protein AAB460_01465 [Patescibacteria group bacterium]